MIGEKLAHAHPQGWGITTPNERGGPCIGRGREQAVEPASSTCPGAAGSRPCSRLTSHLHFSPQKRANWLHHGECPLSVNKHIECSKLGPISAAILRLV